MPITIYIMVGPPCSGKSTKAREMLNDDPTIIRINRDELRIMLKGQYVTGIRAIESVIDDLTKQTILVAAAMGLDVIVDATHCKTRYMGAVRAIGAIVGAEIRYVICDVPYWKQRWRNFWRWLKTGIWIPAHVAKSMDKNFRITKKLIQ